MKRENKKMHEKREELINLFSEITESVYTDAEHTEIISKMIEILKNVERVDFSDSYSIVTTLLKNSQDIECVNGNLQTLKDKCKEEFEKSESIELQKVIKFFDYCLLECVRYADFTSKFDAFKSTIGAASNNAEEAINMQAENLINVQEELVDAQSELFDVKNRLDSSVQYSVTILSIFAGISLAFTGGITLLANAFTSMQGVSKYRLLFLVLLTGFILFNIIASLMFIVSRFNQRDIGVACKSGYYCENCKKRLVTGVVCQGVNKYPHITVVNILFLVLMYIIFIAWLFSPNNQDIFLAFVNITKSEISLNILEVLLMLVPPLLFVIFLYKTVKPPRLDEEDELLDNQ